MKTRKSIFCMVAAVMFTLLAGCGKDFDASLYVKSGLDASTQGQFEEFAEMTGSTVEEVEKEYNDMLDTDVAAFDIYNISDEKKQEMREVFAKMYSSVKYEVKEATKNDDGSYTVPVTISKLIVFDTIMDDVQTYFTEYWENADSDVTEDEVYEEVVNYLADYIREKVDNPQYADPETYEVVVAQTADDSNVYEVKDDGMEELYIALVDFDKFQ